MVSLLLQIIKAAKSPMSSGPTRQQKENKNRNKKVRRRQKKDVPKSVTTGVFYFRLDAGDAVMRLLDSSGLSRSMRNACEASRS
jgi:hypothetical protein